MSHLMTKPTKWHVHPAKTQIRLGIHPVWSETSLCALWVAKDPSFLQADSEDSDQTGWMPRLNWVFAGRTRHFVDFVVKQLSMQAPYLGEYTFFSFCFLYLKIVGTNPSLAYILKKHLESMLFTVSCHKLKVMQKRIMKWAYEGQNQQNPPSLIRVFAVCSMG